MIIVPVATTIEMSPNLIDAVQTTKHLSASERLLLAKLLLDSLVDEPSLTAEEWEQTWWLVHQAMKQRDLARKPITDWIAHENDALPVGRQSSLHNGH
jgi:hypothetical protein